MLFYLYKKQSVSKLRFLVTSATRMWNSTNTHFLCLTEQILVLAYGMFTFLQFSLSQSVSFCGVNHVVGRLFHSIFQKKTLISLLYFDSNFFGILFCALHLSPFLRKKVNSHAFSLPLFHVRLFASEFKS